MSLATLFAASHGKPIVWQGLSVHALFRQAVVDRERVRLEWLTSIRRPVQGLSLNAPKGGALVINGERLSKATLWVDTAPSVVEFECRLKNSPAEITIWNCWRDDASVTHAWLNNAGMLIEESANGFTFRCSSGADTAGPSFDHLLVSLRFSKVAARASDES
jgi:hypothetical protein